MRAPSLRSSSTASLSPLIFQPSAERTDGPTRIKWYLLTKPSIGKVAIFGSFGFFFFGFAFFSSISSAPSPEFSRLFLVISIERTKGCAVYNRLDMQFLPAPMSRSLKVSLPRLGYAARLYLVTNMTRTR